jgi:hypothetical protein
MTIASRGSETGTGTERAWLNGESSMLRLSAEAEKRRKGV